MEVFGNDQTRRGCFSYFVMNAGGGRGSVLTFGGTGSASGSSSGVQKGAGGSAGNYDTQMPSNNFSDPILVTAFQYAHSETYQVTKTFGEKAFIYAFGNNAQAGIATIQFAGFLVAGNSTSDVANAVNSSYATNRLYKSLKMASLSVGSSVPVKGFVVGLTANGSAAEGTSMGTFALQLLVPEL